ncbi:MAG: hypothetical protein EA371_07995 [Gammaproteobacteria bacterium]|nr:MAG: hypothetical protein EA371_07995 [Gammaproteobacteria bacterium]
MPILLPVARAGRTITYQDIAAQLELVPPLTIHRVTDALEALTRADAAAGRPPLAAVAVSRARAGVPAPGFFELLGRLGWVDPGIAAEDPERAHAALHREVVAAARAGVFDSAAQ